MLYYSTYHRARYLENAQDYFIYKTHKEAWWKINIVLGFPWRSHASVRLVDLIDFCQLGRIVKQPSADFICSLSFTLNLLHFHLNWLFPSTHALLSTPVWQQFLVTCSVVVFAEENSKYEEFCIVANGNFEKNADKSKDNITIHPIT